MENMQKQVVIAHSEVLSSLGPEGLRKIMKNLQEDSRPHT